MMGPKLSHLKELRRGLSVDLKKIDPWLPISRRVFHAGSINFSPTVFPGRNVSLFDAIAAIAVGDRQLTADFIL
jgi:hypothetical protein